MDIKPSHEQYNEIDWRNQEKTGINSLVNDQIIDYIVKREIGSSISLFDIGFGVGFFLKRFSERVRDKYKSVYIEGCEPAKKSYEHLLKNPIKGVEFKIYPDLFLETKVSTKFDIVTAIYVLPAIVFNDLEATVRKINSLLKPGGRFVCVITSEVSFKSDQKNDKDLFNLIEKQTRVFKGKSYTELFHKSFLPGIGYVYDYNRDQVLYEDMFTKNGFILEKKEDVHDGYFMNALLIFQKS